MFSDEKLQRNQPAFLTNTKNAICNVKFHQSMCHLRKCEKSLMIKTAVQNYIFTGNKDLMKQKRKNKQTKEIYIYIFTDIL